MNRQQEAFCADVEDALNQLVQLADGRCMLGNSLRYCADHLRARGHTAGGRIDMISARLSLVGFVVVRGRVVIHRWAGRQASPDSKRPELLTGQVRVANWSKEVNIVVRWKDHRDAKTGEVLL